MVALLRIGSNPSLIDGDVYQEVVNGTFHEELLPFCRCHRKFSFSILRMEGITKPINRNNGIFERSAGGNYMLFHKPTQSIYFGETNNLAARALEHMTAIHCKSHVNRAIRRRSRNGYISDWIFSVLCYEQSEFNRKKFERAFINRKWEWEVLNVK
ncbi:GIY-YIG nuclease family protein [Bernardetia sp. ABR2-2B]|uniref:GIY-YIG nuclease family protein n=1 Tax=Bernardetia sp. ABR2-2B TaxID=3127472 RepID=UPI0030D3D63C